MCASIWVTLTAPSSHAAREPATTLGTRHRHNTIHTGHALNASVDAPRPPGPQHNSRSRLPQRKRPPTPRHTRAPPRGAGERATPPSRCVSGGRRGGRGAGRGRGTRVNGAGPRSTAVLVPWSRFGVGVRSGHPRVPLRSLSAGWPPWLPLPLAHTHTLPKARSPPPPPHTHGGSLRVCSAEVRAEGGGGGRPAPLHCPVAVGGCVCPALGASAVGPEGPIV